MGRGETSGLLECRSRANSLCSSANGLISSLICFERATWSWWPRSCAYFSLSLSSYSVLTVRTPLVNSLFMNSACRKLFM